LHFDYDDAIAMIVAGGGEDFVAAAQHVLPHDLRRHVRITGLGEVAVRGAANEAALTLRIEPTRRLAIGNYRRHWRALSAALLLIAARPVLLSAAAALSASALIASATSVVAMIALALLSALMLLAAAAAPAAPAAIVLLVV
jgi:hypothetical protein